jgi:hypothetical protein
MIVRAIAEDKAHSATHVMIDRIDWGTSENHRQISDKG